MYSIVKSKELTAEEQTKAEYDVEELAHYPVEQGRTKTTYLDIYTILAKEKRTSAKYDPDEIIRAITLWIALGNWNEVSKVTGIRANTMRVWKSRSPWWDRVYEFCAREKQQELDSELSSIIHSSAELLRDRILNGEPVKAKSGKYDRRPLKSMELAQIQRHAFEQRSRIRGDVVVSEHKDDAIKQLQRVADTFKEIGGEVYKASKAVNARTIDGETVTTG